MDREVFTGQTYTVELEVTEGPVGVAHHTPGAHTHAHVVVAKGLHILSLSTQNNN